MVRIYWFVLLLLGPIQGLAQQSVLNQFINRYNQFHQERLQEKIYLHLDRTTYTVGETIWFKLYLVDGTLHQPLQSSQVTYVEILNAAGAAVAQLKVGMHDGMGYGSITLPTTLNSDNYEVRAYTNWMKNFDPEFYFRQYISILNPFRALDTKAAPKSGLDIQLFPEGGHLVEGIPSWIAVRAVDSTGKGIEFDGYILNGNDTITRFKPIRFGLARFLITPSVSLSQMVQINTKGGEVHRLEIPNIEPAGFALQVIPSADRFTLTVMTTGQVPSQVYVVAHTRQVVKLAKPIALQNGKATLQILKSELDAGVSHLTVFNSEFKPVTDRLVFVKPAKKDVSLAVEPVPYKTRSLVSAKLQFHASDQDTLNFSMSVFKDDSVWQFTPTNMESYLWLTSDLKGAIESPEFYFSNEPDVEPVADLLMLTHGWSRFRWEDIRSGQQNFLYLPEYRGHLISGIVKNRVTQQPVSNMLAYLAWPQKRVPLTSGISSTGGTILFETNHLVGNQTLYFLTPEDSLTRVDWISPFSTKSVTRIPTLHLSETFKSQLANRSVSMQVQQTYRRTPVTKRQVTDSSTFYGQAPESYLLDDYTRFPLLEEVMREYVKGVRVRKKDNQFVFKVLNTQNNTVFDREPLVLLDGVPIFDTNRIMELNPIKIKQLDVYTRHYFFGSQNYDGLVSFRTYQGDLGGFQVGPETITLNYEGLHAVQEFFTPKYETAEARNSRLPDARHLLYWSPLGVLTGNKQVDFYTSDQPGRYRIVLQGITITGLPVSQQVSFQVEK